MKVKVKTAAMLKTNVRGARRTGQRVVAKGTEPCILTPLSDDGPCETEGYITVMPTLTISMPEYSVLDRYVRTHNKVVIAASFLTGKMTPLNVVLIPDTEQRTWDQAHGTVIYQCTSCEMQTEDIHRYINAYKIIREKN